MGSVFLLKYLVTTVSDFFFSFSFSRRLEWKSLKFPMILNSLDLRSSVSVKSNQRQIQRTEINGMAQLHCSQFQKPLLPKGGGGGNDEEKEA